MDAEDACLVDGRGAFRTTELPEGTDAHDRVGLRRRERPGAGGPAVHEEDRFDDRVLRIDGGTMSRGDDAVAVLVADEQLVISRKKAHRRTRVRGRSRPAPHVEEDVTPLVGETLQ